MVNLPNILVKKHKNVLNRDYISNESDPLHLTIQDVPKIGVKRNSRDKAPLGVSEPPLCSPILHSFRVVNFLMCF